MLAISCLSEQIVGEQITVPLFIKGTETTQNTHDDYRSLSFAPLVHIFSMLW